METKERTKYKNNRENSFKFSKPRDKKKIAKHP